MEKSRLLAFASIAALVSAMLIGCSGSPSSDFYDEMPTEPKMYVAPGEVPSTPSEEQKLLVSQLAQYEPDLNDSLEDIAVVYPGAYSSYEEFEPVTIVKYVFKLSGKLSGYDMECYGEFLDSKGNRHTVSMNYESTTWKGTVTIDGNTYETCEPDRDGVMSYFARAKDSSETDSKTLSLFDSVPVRHCDVANKTVFQNVDMIRGEDLPARKASGMRFLLERDGEPKFYKDFVFDDGNKLQYVYKYSKTTEEDETVLKETVLFVRLNGVLLDPAAF